ncbi:ketoacyl-ACP synthase III [Candidatus Aminicenantes bacterium AC-335-A11]|jgi:3-oxoacyl-[acyl-carrier-protein] synthase-3|nr:ketoacyl-ACP synthase III [SCandidatus Aminicenantes bacterium Aminicenantia_JdfR_composite]MCP2596412.1 ketoacyl-ACP synthase III [Candidatus Aminicenantes bacterium AC-335-G13]MCP2606193.1 ketoacyl-ACP synthase III [Candidatus Aminicenantes bacterium AC-708-I09]MCP2618210.1 ketoacyl-ACP synthase III [Candidatus Aminicenantes bacterium AC-335-A11]
MGRIKIIGTGSYVPEKILTNYDLEKMVDTSDEWIVTRTGIKERRIASPDEATSDMIIEASKKALENAGIKAQDIDLIIVATVTPDNLFPSTACWVQKALGLKDIPALDISAACPGFLYALILAESLILSKKNKRVLVAGAEMLSKITNWEDRSTCVLFGDGAGVAILEEGDDESGILSSYWAADGSLGDLLIQPAGGSRMPATYETVEKKLHTVHMKGNEVFKHAVKKMGEAALKALSKAGLTGEDIDIFIPHQANIRIIEATCERLKVPKEKVYINIHKYGNVSAATIPIALDELNREGKLKKGDVILMDSFGAGFTWSAVVMRW